MDEANEQKKKKTVTHNTHTDRRWSEQWTQAITRKWTKRKGKTFTKDKVFRNRIDIDLLINRENNLRFFMCAAGLLQLCGYGNGGEYLGYLIGWHVTVTGTNHLYLIFWNAYLLFCLIFDLFSGISKKKRKKKQKEKSNDENFSRKTKSAWNEKSVLCKCDIKWLHINSLNKLCAAGSIRFDHRHTHTHTTIRAQTRYFAMAMSFISFWFYLSLVENMCVPIWRWNCTANSLSVSHANK